MTQPPSTPSNNIPDHSEPACLGKQQRTLKSTGKIAEVATPQSEQIEGTLDHSTTWDIELEDGILPSDSSSFAWGTTVVIDAGNIWNHQDGMQQSLQTVTDSCDKPRSVVARGPDECSCSSPRVASRFFSKCVPGFGLYEDRPSPRTPTIDWEDHPDREPEVSSLGDVVDCHCPDAGWDRSSNQEADSFFGGGCAVRPGTYIRCLWGGGSD